MEELSRIELLIGEENVQKIRKSNVCIFGVGGVGGFAAEALCRCGVGKLTVFDSDVVAKSNLNRQIIATSDNVGEKKVEAIKKRLLSINPSAEIVPIDRFYLPENADEYSLKQFDYVIDAVDTITAKLEIIARAKAVNVPVISSMGTGGKIYPEKLKVADIKKTSGCPLARVMRRELKKRGIENLKVIYSDEEMKYNRKIVGENNKVTPPSMIFVPATAGLIIAREVVFDIVKSDKDCKSPVT